MNVRPKNFLRWLAHFETQGSETVPQIPSSSIIFKPLSTYVAFRFLSRPSLTPASPLTGSSKSSIFSLTSTPFYSKELNGPFRSHGFNWPHRLISITDWPPFTEPWDPSSCCKGGPRRFLRDSGQVWSNGQTPPPHRAAINPRVQQCNLWLDLQPPIGQLHLQVEWQIMTTQMHHVKPARVPYLRNFQLQF